MFIVFFSVHCIRIGLVVKIVVILYILAHTIELAYTLPLQPVKTLAANIGI